MVYMVIIAVPLRDIFAQWCGAVARARLDFTISPPHRRL